MQIPKLLQILQKSLAICIQNQFAFWGALHFYCFSASKVRIRLWIGIHYKRWFTDRQGVGIIIHIQSGVSDLWASGPFSVEVVKL